ncbi:MAG TPA: hypothetical protein VF059_01945 [Casimicrobiaceae bacterium]
MSGDLRPLQRAPLLALGFVGLVVGVAAGLARLGYRVPEIAASVSSLHGPLMIGGFFGVVIALERAVAIGRYWAYLGPLLAGLGTVAIVAGAVPAAPWLLLGGSVVLLAASLDVLRRQRALFTLTLALGAACWPIGNLLWAAGLAVHDVVAWWLAFLILTIAGERLELSRFLPPSPAARHAFVAILVVVFAGLVAARQPFGPRLLALGLLALAAWLLKQDIARRTVRKAGLTRFIAICLLSGYAWLAVGAITMLAGSFVPGARSYDAALHALALGFVFSMVFGHAPVIFPAVLRVPVPYHWSFYVPLALLHGSLIVRLAGDAADRFEWTRVGGILNALALAAFIIGTASAVLRAASRRSPAQPSAPPPPGGAAPR